MDVIARCPMCGNPQLPDASMFPRMQQKLFDFIIANPDCKITAIMNHLYGNDPNGGPESNIISSMLSQMKPVLTAHGLRIEVGRGRSSWGYRLVKEPSNVVL